MRHIMDPFSFNRSFSKFHCGSIKGFFCVFSIFFITCCHNNETTGYSKAFKPVFDTVTIYFETNRLGQGLHYLDSSLNHINNPTTDDQFRTYGFHYVYEYKAKLNFEKSMLYADSMLNLVSEKVTNDARYVPDYVEASFAMGDSYFKLQRYDEAYQHFFKGYVTGKSSLNKIALADYNYRMGMITYKMGNYKAAARYFKECLRFTDKTKGNFLSFYTNQEMLDNIALSFKHNNQTDSAIIYFNKALKFISQNGQLFPEKIKRIEVARGVIYGNEAEVLISKNDYNAASELLKKSIGINLRKFYDYHDAELAEIKLARLYYEQNDDSLLFSLLNTMRPQIDTIKDDGAAAEWNRLMSMYYSRNKDFPKAFEYLQKYNTINDAIIKEKNLLTESNVNKQVDNYEKQFEIDDLMNHSKIQRIYLYVAVVCALMALMIIFLVYRNWKRSKKEVQIVNYLNQQINVQNKVLEKTLNDLNNNSQEKDRILRAVAHDLRNPLGGIAALTNVMADDDYTADQKGMISLIKETSKNSLELINEILEVTNSGTAALKKEVVEINSLVAHSLELMRFKAAEKAQVIKMELLEAPQELFISSEKIWRVINNLVSNALKFSPTISEICVKIVDKDNYVEISVKDNGIGIPEAMNNKVFNMFTEAKRPGTSGEKSFGLGLSISRQIIENHGGKIWFESEINSGSTFFISLPKI